MQNDILPNVIFSPGELAINLANELVNQEVAVTMFTAGKVNTEAELVSADLTFFQKELQVRNDTYISLLKKHPLTFITLARQAQAALLADAFHRANSGEFDIVHVYTNEEDIALPFAQLCNVPVVFTHHDPFNFLTGYRNTFPKYKHLSWISISNNQRTGMPEDTHWLGTIYHGLDPNIWQKQNPEKEDYVAFIGRIIEPKGLDIAIKAVQRYNRVATKPLKFKIAGKHYGGSGKNSYWGKTIVPLLSDPNIEYVGFIKDIPEKQMFLAKARALLVPSVFAEPFGMVMIESLACGTPIIGLDSGAIPEVVNNGVTGIVVKKHVSTAANGKLIIEEATVTNFSKALSNIDTLDDCACRREFETRFTLAKMATEHHKIYRELLRSSS